MNKMYAFLVLGLAMVAIGNLFLKEYKVISLILVILGGVSLLVFLFAYFKTTKSLKEKSNQSK